MWLIFVKRVCVCFLCLPALVQADSIYSVITGGYVGNEMQAISPASASYKFGVGYQIAPQWYIETGFQMLGENNLNPDLIDMQSEMFEGAGLYVAALGKARGRYGELFYKLGVLKADLKADYPTQGNCKSDAHTLYVDPMTQRRSCQFDDGVLAGIIGLGFDYFLSTNTSLRFEIEHIRGENQYQANAAYLGLRVNF